MSMPGALAKRWGLTAGAIVVTALVMRFAATPAPLQTNASEPYRVELVNGDPYKIQTALNNLSKQGWYFVSCVTRQDKKVLLVFRRTE
jgi:hypothetical protein